MSNSSSQHSARPQHPPRLLERVREAPRRKPDSYRTEQAYIDWIKRYILFRNWKPDTAFARSRSCWGTGRRRI